MPDNPPDGDAPPGWNCGPLDFLNARAATMPRTALRYAIEHLDQPQRQHYLQLKAPGPPTSM